MNKLDKRKVDILIHRLGLKYNLSDETIKQLVESPYLFTYEKMRDMDLSEIQTQEDLDKLKTNFLYKAFGKIIVSMPLINRRNKAKEHTINLNKNKWKKKH